MIPTFQWHRLSDYPFYCFVAADENGNILITMDSRLIAKWEDNERDYICYSTVDNINNQECILTLDVQHKYT